MSGRVIAMSRARVCTDDWNWKDAAIGLLFVMTLIGGFAMHQLGLTRAELEAAKADAVAAKAQLETAASEFAGVQLIDSEGHYRCAPPTRIRREWVAGIGLKCQELATAMYAARATE